VKRLSTKGKHVNHEGGHAGEPHTIALAQPKIDSTPADGRVVAAQPPPLAPPWTPPLAQPLVPSTPVGGGSEGLHHADPDSGDDDNADNGVDDDVVSCDADRGGDDAESGADVDYDDDSDSDDEDTRVGLLHKNEIRPGQVGVTRLDEICSVAGTPPPDEGRAHIWRRVQAKRAAVDNAVGSGVQPAWGIEDPEDLHLEPRESSRNILWGTPSSTGTQIPPQFTRRSTTAARGGGRCG